jgi:hypothetical protein
VNLESLIQEASEAGFDFSLPGTGIWFVGLIDLPYDEDIELSDPRTQNRFADVEYNIVEMTDGRWTTYSSDERQTLSRDWDDDGERLISFDSESALCNYIWKELTTSELPGIAEPVAEPQLAAQAQRQDEEYARKLAVYNKEHGLG